MRPTAGVSQLNLTQGSLFLDFGVTLPVLPLIYLGGIRAGVQPQVWKSLRVHLAADIHRNLESERGVIGKRCMPCFMVQNS